MKYTSYNVSYGSGGGSGGRVFAIAVAVIAIIAIIIYWRSSRKRTGLVKYDDN